MDNIKIIGAGPAGLITGLKLLEAGFKPTIIEKNEAITTTLCGEGLSAGALERVPFAEWSRFAPQSFSHATFIFPGGYKAYVKKKCYTMDRLSWFRAMTKEFEKRGGTIEFGTEIKDIKKLKYCLLIGADGPFSVVARHIGNKTTHIAGVQYRIKSGYKFDGMEFFLNKMYSSEYSWIFAKGNTLNVGLLGMQKDLDRFVQDMKLPDMEIIKKEAYSIPFFGTKIQEGNIILTGDAAGITNPLTKGGMAAVIHVAEIIADCVKQNKISEYQQRVFSHPVMASEYKKALEYFKEMDNKSLEKIGKMLDGKDLLNIDKATKIKMLLASMLKPMKMRTLMKAAGYANKYSW